jgi:carbon monoxide dehydrogenase subunit G
MDLTHTFTVPAPIDEAWAAFNDLELIAPCFPGASLTTYDGEQFEGLVKVKLGPISLQYTGTGRFVERDEAAHRAVLEAKGRDKRGNGTAAASVTAELNSVGEESTEVTVVTDLNITGKPAQFGRGVMQDVSDKLLAQFTTCLETKLGAPEEPAVEEPEVETAPAEETPVETAPAEETPTPPSPEPSGAEATTAATASATTGSPTPSRPMAGPGPAAPSAGSTPAAALDLGATVLPVLLKRYAVQIVGAVIVLLVLRRLLRRRR